MAHYVLSDIHGYQNRFDAMLDAIGFSETDTLYILGDVIDRGPDGVRLLERIMAAPNMVMLLGNHEYMCLQFHAPGATADDLYRWSRNGCAPTLRGLKRLDRHRRAEVLDFLQSIPTQITVEVDGQAFLLVHGFPADTVYGRVWGRPEPETPNPEPGTTLIIGHTPVLSLGRSGAEIDAEIERLAAAGEHLRIYHGPGFMDIDCGVGYNLPCSRLACLRLEDLAEFYT